MPPIVLASSSQYRCKLLKKLQIEFTTQHSNIDERPLSGESPADLALRLAAAKAEAVAANYDHHLIIGSDQVATVGLTLLSKPGNRENAIRQLEAQSGQIVRFFTGLCVLDSHSGRRLTDLDICEVHFRTLDNQQIQRYVDIEQPYDCAGGFKSEGYGIALFRKIVGEDPNALIGLPLIKLIALLDQFGAAIP